MKFYIFADIHYFSGDRETARFDTQKKLTQYAIGLMDALTHIINTDPECDFCVNLGDMIQDNNDHDQDLEALRFVFQRLERIVPPCHTILGNHDLKMMDSVQEIEALTHKSFTFSLDVKGIHFVFLTTEVRPELGIRRGGIYKTQTMSEAALRWLQEDLAQTKLPCIVFTHYPLAEDDSLEDPCLFMKNRAEVKSILKESGKVLCVFSGHQHVCRTHVEDGIPHYLLGSLCGCTMEPGVPDGSYFTVTVEGTRVCVQEKRVLLH